MSNSPDTTDEEKKTSDLLALLYPGEGQEIDGSLYEGDEELESYKGLRSLFAQVTDEEPSEALCNKLLAMAAQHAPTPKEESRGLLARLSSFLAPLMAHPGLAAAATLLLLVGVAGSLYLKGGTKVAEPTVSSQAEAPADSKPSPTSALATLSEESGAPEEAEEADQEPEAEAEGQALEDLPAKPSAGRASMPDPQPSKELSESNRDKQLNAAPRGSRTYLDPNSSDGLGNLGKSLGAGHSGDEDAYRVKDIDTRDFESGGSAPPPPPKAPKADTARSKVMEANDLGDDDEAPEQEPAANEKEEKKAKDGTVLAREFHSKALAAAKEGDCKSVLALGLKVRAADGAYYDRSFLSDSVLQPCWRTQKKSQSTK